MKLIRFILISLSTFWLTLGAIVSVKWYLTPTATTPLPYELETYEPFDIDAPILIIGDEKSEQLAAWKDLISKEISRQYDKPIRIASISQKEDSLFKTLQKLQALKKWPRIVLVFLSNYELREQKYLWNQHQAVSWNLKIYNNSFFKTILTVFPSLSRLLYWPWKNLNLPIKGDNLTLDYHPLPSLMAHMQDEKNPQSKSQPHPSKILTNQIAIFKIELEKLYQLSLENNSQLYFISAPFNLDQLPRSSCLHLNKEESDRAIENLKSALAQENWKNLSLLAKNFVDREPTSSFAHYFLGISAKFDQKFIFAQQSLEKSYSLDCQNRTSLPLFNEVARQFSQTYSIPFFDFHRFVFHQSLIQNPFVDERDTQLTPQIWKKVAEQLTELLSI